MVLYTILIAVGLVLIMGVAFLIGRSQQRTAAVRFSRRFGLDVPDGMEPSIRANVQARHSGALIGTAVTETIAVVLLLALPGLQLLASWWVLFASYLVGAGIGSAMAVLLAERKREQGVIRVARSSAVAVDDYVAPLQAVFAWVCVVIAILALAGDLWLTANSSAEYLSVVSVVLVGLAIVMLVIYEIVARRLVSRGALAGTTLELAWDDALRAYALSNLSVMVALIGLYSLIGYDTLLVNDPSALILSQSVFAVYTAFLPIAATVAILMLVVITRLISSRQYFLRRLWPELAVKVDDNVDGTYTSMMGGR